MDNKVIDITKYMKKPNKIKNSRDYDMDISKAYADELTDEFMMIIKREKEIKDDERRR